MSKRDMCIIAAAVAIAAVALFGLYSKWSACEDRGGILLRGAASYVCVDAKAVK